MRVACLCSLFSSSGFSHHPTSNTCSETLLHLTPGNMSRNPFSSSRRNARQASDTSLTAGDRRPPLRRMPQRSQDLRSALRPPHQVAAAVGMPGPASSSSSAAQPNTAQSNTNRPVSVASFTTKTNVPPGVPGKASSEAPSTGQLSQSQITSR
jgi:hypothetical protein